MDKLSSDIKASREIKAISLKNYLSAIKQLHKKIEGEKDFNLDFSKHFDTTMNEINKLKNTTKKNYLTSLVVALKAYPDKYKDEIEYYCNKLKDVNDTYQKLQKEQKKTQTQQDNWMTYEELVQKKEDLKKKYNQDKTYENLQRYIMILTYINHPLRNDFAEMKVIKRADFNKLSKDEQTKYNYLILQSGNKMSFMINQYKNSKYLGSRELQITDGELKRVINKWLKENTSGWYFVKSDRTTPQTPNNTTKYLNKIFKPKKISSSMIRHIVISHDLKDEPTLKEQEEKQQKIEDKYLHSVNMNNKYRKVK